MQSSEITLQAEILEFPVRYPGIPNVELKFRRQKIKYLKEVIPLKLRQLKENRSRFKTPSFV